MDWKIAHAEYDKVEQAHSGAEQAIFRSVTPYLCVIDDNILSITAPEQLIKVFRTIPISKKDIDSLDHRTPFRSFRLTRTGVRENENRIEWK